MSRTVLGVVDHWFYLQLSEYGVVLRALPGMHKGPFTHLSDSRSTYLRPRSVFFVCIFLVLLTATSASIPLAVSHADQARISRLQSAAVDGCDR